MPPKNIFKTLPPLCKWPYIWFSFHNEIIFTLQFKERKLIFRFGNLTLSSLDMLHTPSATKPSAGVHVVPPHHLGKHITHHTLTSSHITLIRTSTPHTTYLHPSHLILYLTTLHLGTLTPHTTHHTPHISYHTPHISHLTPYTLAPHTLHPHTLHPHTSPSHLTLTPYTLHPHTLHPHTSHSHLTPSPYTLTPYTLTYHTLHPHISHLTPSHSHPFTPNTLHPHTSYRTPCSSHTPSHLTPPQVTPSSLTMCGCWRWGGSMRYLYTSMTALTIP